MEKMQLIRVISENRGKCTAQIVTKHKKRTYTMHTKVVYSYAFGKVFQWHALGFVERTGEVVPMEVSK